MREQNFIERIAYEGSRRSMKGHFTSYLFDYFPGDVSKEEGQSRSPAPRSDHRL